MRLPTKRQRWALASVGGGGLITAILGGLFGPLTQPTYGLLSPAATLQLDLLEVLAFASAFCFALAFVRLSRLELGAPVLSGLLVGGLGLWLSFGYWVPNHGDAARYGWVAPYSAQGTTLILWGGAVFVLGLMIPWTVSQRLKKVASQARLQLANESRVR